VARFSISTRNIRIGQRLDHLTLDLDPRLPLPHTFASPFIGASADAKCGLRALRGQKALRAPRTSRETRIRLSWTGGKPTTESFIQRIGWPGPHGQGAAARFRGSPGRRRVAQPRVDVRRHAAPSAPSARHQMFRVAPRAGLTVELGVRGARVDDADVAHHPGSGRLLRGGFENLDRACR